MAIILPSVVVWNSRGLAATSQVTLRQGYRSLSDRLNLFPQEAPPTELLFRILQVLFTEEEAALAARLPLRPFTAAAAADNWKRTELQALKILENLASRGMLLDMELESGRFFVLPPPMAGFFEFSMMRVGTGIRPKAVGRAVLPVPERRGRLQPRSAARSSAGRRAIHPRRLTT
jgi:hypothetical protein